MTVPELPLFDSKTFTRRLYERVLTPVTGKKYAVFNPDSPVGFPVFVDGLRNQQDIVKNHDVQLVDQKNHLDQLDERESTHHQAQHVRLAALEEAVQNPPFPG